MILHLSTLLSVIMAGATLPLPFHPPAEFEGKWGNYRSPLIFDDRTRVTKAADWPRRREEILRYWHGVMGPWPAVLTKPKVDVLSEERRENFLQQRVRIELAPGQMEEAWLLLPNGAGPFPAVLVLYYEPETSVGLKNAERDFGLQLARRGFVTLNIGTPGGDARNPDLGKAKCQPLSFHSYIAANCWHALANLPQVDAKRIGVVGHSYGGKRSLFAGALWDKFACVVTSDPGIVWDEANKSINYWEPWYLGLDPSQPKRKPGLITADNPRTGAYAQLVKDGRDLTDLIALICPRPFLVSGGHEDPPVRWTALNHAIAVNKLLGVKDRVAMTNRKDHSPNPDSNAKLYAFFERFLKAPAQEPIRIVVPANPSATEKHAAKELAHYLGRACGATFPVVSEPQSAGDPCIAVGRMARVGTLKEADLGVDGFVLRRAGASLHICGVNDRGTLYGVYEFLRKHVGCAWYMPGEIGEVVPRLTTFRLPDINETHKPAFEWRGFTMTADLSDKTPGRGRDLGEWLARNRVNTFYTHRDDKRDTTSEETAFWAERGGIRKRWMTHSWQRLLPFEKYFPDHPEWYALIGGKRTAKDKNAKLCTSNPEVIERIAQGAIEYLSAHPDEELYAITESDGLGWCECEKCKAQDDGRIYSTETLDAGKAETRGKHVCPVVTNRMILLANAVAERVAKVHPSKLLYILSYHADFPPPTGGLKPHPNVMVQVVHNRPLYLCVNHPMENDCARNVAFRQGLEEWLRISKHVTVYDYDRHSQMKSLPFIVPRKFVEDLRYLKRVGVEGFLDQGTETWGISAISRLAIAEAMWNPDVDVTSLLDRFYNSFYGAAGPHMKRFYETLETSLRRHDCINLEHTRMLSAYLTTEVIIEAEKHLRQAQAAARSDMERRRVEMTAQCFDFAQFYASATRALWQHQETKDARHLQAAIEGFEQAAELTAKHGNSPYLVGENKKTLNKAMIENLERQLPPANRD